MSWTNTAPISGAHFPSGARATFSLAAFVVVAGAISLWVVESAKAASNPFDLLKGDWEGGGTVWLTDRPAKKVECKATYKVSGNNLSQNLSCTGEDYEIEAKLKLTDKGGKVKGSWTEAIYDASGGVTGKARENIIRAVIRGDKFSGRMSLNVTDAGHAINIVQLDEKSGVYRLVTSLFLRRE